MISGGGSWRVIRRHELSDAEWEFVRPLLPESLRGRKRLDDRTVLNGIVWKFRTGTAWRDVPERYGPWATLPPASVAGPWTAPSSGCSRPPRPGRTRRETSTGSCRSTPPSSAPTSTLPGPEKGAPKPGTRTLPGRPDQQDLPGLRRGGTAAGLPACPRHSALTTSTSHRIERGDRRRPPGACAPAVDGSWTPPPHCRQFCSAVRSLMIANRLRRPSITLFLEINEATRKCQW